VIGPSWPNCSLVLWTWPMKSMNPSPDLGTPCSGQSVKWNCRIVRDWPSRASVTCKQAENFDQLTRSKDGVSQPIRSEKS
jgi:hypothetical protein